jgi:hypothetical protein
MFSVRTASRPAGAGNPTVIQRLFRNILAPLLLAVTVLTAGNCGYEMDAPRLPNNHRTLALSPVRNRTFEGELDVRLQQSLRRILYRTAGVQLVSPGESGLLLTLEIQKLDLVRSRSLDSTTVLGLGYHIAGTITLKEQGTGKLLIDKQPLLLNTSYALPVADLETPAVRDDALNGVLEKFAEAIVAQLLVNFNPQDRPPAKVPEAQPGPKPPSGKAAPTTKPEAVPGTPSTGKTPG